MEEAGKSLPTYLRSEDTTAISNLLKRLSVSSTREIDFFHKICSAKQAVLPYKEALLLTETQDEPFIFTSFVNRFQNLQLMVLRTSISENRLFPDYLRICDEGGMDFYYEYISEQIHNIFVNNEMPLLTYKDLLSKGIDIPKQYIIPLTQDHFIEAFKAFDNKKDNKEDTKMAIYSFPIFNKVYILTRKTIPLMCDLCIIRIRVLIENPAISAFLATFLDIPIADVREKIESNNYVLWDEIITNLHNNIEKIRSNQSIIHNPELIDLIILLFHTIKPRLLQIKETERISKLIETFEYNISNFLQKKTRGIHFSQLNDTIDKEAQNLNLSEEQTQEAVNSFYKNQIITNENINTHLNLKRRSIILKVDNLFIHSDNLIRIISENFFPLSNRLKDYYINLLYKYLLNKLSPTEVCFFDEEQFEMSVHQKVREFDEIYTQLLKNPVFLANVIASSSSDNRVPSNQFDQFSITQKLALFYNLRTKKLLAWYEIFGLKLDLLIEAAYQKLTLLRKLLLILSGRYKLVKERIAKIKTSASQMAPDSPEQFLENVTTTTAKTTEPKKRLYTAKLPPEGPSELKTKKGLSMLHHSNKRI